MRGACGERSELPNVVLYAISQPPFSSFRSSPLLAGIHRPLSEDVRVLPGGDRSSDGFVHSRARVSLRDAPEDVRQLCRAVLLPPLTFPSLLGRVGGEGGDREDMGGTDGREEDGNRGEAVRRQQAAFMLLYTIS